MEELLDVEVPLGALISGGMDSASIAALLQAHSPERLHTFTTLALANMLAELRKYGVGLILANQYMDQIDSEIRTAILGNAGTLISFRLGAEDAAYIAREFGPAFRTEDLIGLPNYRIYLRLMIEGEPSKPFSAATG